MSKAVFLAFALYIAWLFFNEVRRREGVSLSVWAVVAWITMLGSRSVSTWFDYSVDATVAQGYDEGSPVERSVYFALIFYGLVVLLHRRLRWGEVMASNGWLLMFFLYWGLSAFWADAPLISVKRWVKDVGNVVMVLVILSEAQPLQAMQAAFVRAACLLLPLSVLFIRFIPELGRTYHVWSGEMMFTGITTHKNSLGVVALVSLMFLMWDYSSRALSGKGPRSTLLLMWDFLSPTPMPTRASLHASVPASGGQAHGSWPERLGELSLIAMALWLLVKSASGTALGCFAVGTALLLALSCKPLRLRVRWMEFAGALAALAVWTSGSAQALLNYVVVDVFGRDPTLTTRTDVWPMLMSKVEHPLFGAGFNGFWTGERLTETYAQLQIIQAHNGYLETYLNGGWLGLGLLALVLLSALRHANRQLICGNALAKLAFALIAVMMVHNFTEASFNKTSPLWFAFLMVVVRYEGRHTASAVLRGAPRVSARAVPQRHAPY
jgi:exopolysaccharide production protein ExoQ